MLDDAGMIQMAAYNGPHRDAGGRTVFPFPLSDLSATGRAILSRSVLHYPDVEHGEDVPPIAKEGWRVQGVRAAIVAPMLWEGKGRRRDSRRSRDGGPLFRQGDRAPAHFADQAVIAIQNARLVSEIQQKSRELEVANKHKSAFLASMSHELRTPLNAIIGFSEVLLARLFGELNEKQDDYLKDIHTSGKHLLNLINDVLDLSKVEAGRMDLEPSQFDLPAALADAMTLIRERATKHGIQLALDGGAGARRRSRPTSASSSRSCSTSCPTRSSSRRTAGASTSRRTRVDGRRASGGERHGHRHRAGGPGGGVRGVPPGGRRLHEQAGGHGPRARAHAPLRRAPRRPHLADERARQGIDLLLHDT